VKERYGPPPANPHTTVPSAALQLLPDERAIIHLVTKARHFHHPYTHALWQALHAATDIIHSLPSAKRILMPRLGTGLDRLP
jgi:hypothetical protein